MVGESSTFLIYDFLWNICLILFKFIFALQGNATECLESKYNVFSIIWSCNYLVKLEIIRNINLFPHSKRFFIRKVKKIKQREEVILKHLAIPYLRKCNNCFWRLLFYFLFIVMQCKKTLVSSHKRENWNILF